MDIKKYRYHFFLAYSSNDDHAAKSLYHFLSREYEVFLDSETLLPGDEWTRKLPEALREAMIVVVLVSRHTEAAFYQREEIAVAIDLARRNPHLHRVVPVYLDRPDRCEIPYGLRQLKPIRRVRGDKQVADDLFTLLHRLLQEQNLNLSESITINQKEGGEHDREVIAPSWSNISMCATKIPEDVRSRLCEVTNIGAPWAELVEPPIDRSFLEFTLFEIANKHRLLALIYLDVDGMLAINARYGPLVGNEVLRIVHDMLQQMTSPHPARRCGKDEFLVCLLDSDRSQALELSNRILEQMRRYPWEKISTGLYATASLGVAEYRPSEPVADWIIRAIHGCLIAKREHPGSVAEGPISLPREISRNLRDYGS